MIENDNISYVSTNLSCKINFSLKEKNKKSVVFDRVAVEEMEEFYPFNSLLDV